MKTIFTFLLFCCFHHLAAQNSSNVLNASAGLSAKATVFSSLKSNNNEWYVLGTTEDSLYLSTSSYSCTGKNIFLSQIGSTGNTNWSRFIKYNSSVKTAGLVKDGTGNIYITALAVDGIEVNGQSYPWSGSKYVVIKYDASGNFVWLSTLSTHPTMPYAPTVGISNTDLLLVVTAQDSLVTNNQNISFNNNDLKICVVKMDFSGQVNNIVTIEGTGDVNTVTGEPIINTANELFIACQAFKGDTLKLNGNIVVGGSQAQSGFFIIKTDGTLNNITANTFVSASRYANTNKTSNITSLSLSPTGALYLAGIFADSISAGNHTITNFNAPNPVGLTDNFLLALDKDLHVKWLNRIGAQNNNDWIGGVAAANNGKVYITGTADGNIHIGAQTLSIPTNHRECYLIELDTNGVMLNSKLSVSLAPLSAGIATPNGLSLSSDGALLIFGRTNADIIFENDTLFRKSIESGFVWHTSFMTTGFPLLENNQRIFNGFIYPNPVANDAYVQLILPEEKHLKIQIVSATGYGLYRIPLQKYSKGVHTIHLPFSNVAAGVYICQIIDRENKIMDTSKIIKK